MKRKRLFSILAIFLLIYPAIGQSETLVKGIISNDTVWTRAESPYIVTGNILVQESIKLRIEPGVIVKFRMSPIKYDAYYIRVDGTLIAEGNPENRIVFTSEDGEHHWEGILFTDKSVDWDETTSTGSILDNCILEYGNNFYSLVIGGAIINCSSSSPMIKNNIVRYSNKDGIKSDGSGSPKIISNYIYKNKSVGISMMSSGIIENNYIADNGQGIYTTTGIMGDIEISKNSIHSSSSESYGACLRIDINDYPWIISGGIVRIVGNDISSNNSNSTTISLILSSAINFERISFINNNIEIIEGIYSISLSSFPGYTFNNNTLNMQNNWWGTTDTNEISQMINDFNDDFNLPLVNYQPIAMQKFSDAGSNLPPIISPPPVANAGPDQLVFDMIILDASLSSSPDEGIVSYNWSLKHRGNPDYDLSAEGMMPTVSNLFPGFYDVTLTVNDNNGGIDTDIMVFGAIGRKGDLNLDGVIDGSDLSEFAENFGW